MVLSFPSEEAEDCDEKEGTYLSLDAKEHMSSTTYVLSFAEAQGKLLFTSLPKELCLHSLQQSTEQGCSRKEC